MQKILASDGQASDTFGYSVAMSGNYAIIGAPLDDSAGYSSGSAYIFHRSNSTWSQQSKIYASDSQLNLAFGNSVAISGDYLIVGTCYNGDYSIQGSAYIFKRDGTTWTEQEKITASDGFDDDWFGRSVAISDNYALVNGPNKSAYIFSRDETTWTEQAIISPSDPDGDGFGGSLSITENYAAIGADMDGEWCYSGAAYIFHRTGTAWSEQAKLTASDDFCYYQFGLSIALSELEDCLVVGACDSYEYGGSGAYIFDRTGTVWTEVTKLQSESSSEDNFGSSVSFYGDYVIVGAHGDDNGGSAYIFHRNGRSWSQQSKIIPSDVLVYDSFGYAVSIFGEYSLVGSFCDDNENGSDAGSSYIFHLVVPLLTPVNVQIEISDTILTLNWDEVIGAISYKVFSGIDPDNITNLEEMGITDTFWVDTEIEMSYKKFYNVVATSSLSN